MPYEAWCFLVCWLGEIVTDSLLLLLYCCVCGNTGKPLMIRIRKLHNYMYRCSLLFEWVFVWCRIFVIYINRQTHFCLFSSSPSSWLSSSTSSIVCDCEWIYNFQCCCIRAFYVCLVFTCFFAFTTNENGF